MSSTPTSLANDSQAGQLLQELEARQDDVLQQLDDLDAKLHAVLKGLGVSIEEEPVVECAIGLPREPVAA